MLITTLLLFIFFLIVLIIWWLLSYAAPQRTRQLQAQAPALGFTFNNWQLFPEELRAKHFRFLQWGENRYVRNWLAKQEIVLFDHISVTDKGTSQQTVFILPCPLNLEGHICLNKIGLKSIDSFVNASRYLRPVDEKDLPDELAGWSCLADQIHRMRRWFTPDAIHWLKEHPQVHIEWSKQYLLVTQLDYLLEAQEIQEALKDIARLIQALHMYEQVENDESHH